MKRLLSVGPLLRIRAMALLIGLQPRAVTAAHDCGDRSKEDCHRIEHHRSPCGYARPERPRELESRPHEIDRPYYNHKFMAEHRYHTGPYHAPGAWHYQRWSYGEMLPFVFHGAAYLLSDYWLFGLDIPPVGYEWVRYGNDAILTNMATGEIAQVVYDLYE